MEKKNNTKKKRTKYTWKLRTEERKWQKKQQKEKEREKKKKEKSQKKENTNTVPAGWNWSIPFIINHSWKVSLLLHYEHFKEYFKEYFKV